MPLTVPKAAAKHPSCKQALAASASSHPCMTQTQTIVVSSAQHAHCRLKCCFDVQDCVGTGNAKRTPTLLYSCFCHHEEITKQTAPHGQTRVSPLWLDTNECKPNLANQCTQKTHSKPASFLSTPLSELEPFYHKSPHRIRKAYLHPATTPDSTIPSPGASAGSRRWWRSGPERRSFAQGLGLGPFFLNTFFHQPKSVESTTAEGV